MTLWYRYDKAGDLVLTLHIQTGAKITGMAGIFGDALKIKLAAAPVEGKANAVLLSYLANRFNVPLAQVVLKQGEKSRHKVVVIQQPIPDPEQRLNELQHFQ
ncbi:DUF167 domain-containing protein [Nitrosomonas sp.]|uniref:DUF167 domain-containing protein n=1 Tax=Nitrosomonas sp. TaxID=42353 RepID=UPI001D2A26F5|nr:DUF167 domain-containing protein [Nitrosomonas sp.]MBX3617931.1 DUF167 domain-containing protein [Nitrosomonas sp.]